MNKCCHIIGVLDDGAASLSDEARGLLAQADVVIGGQRLLERLAAGLQPAADCRDLTGKLSQVPGWIEQALNAGHNVVVVATGDPLCHGIAGFLLGKLGAARLRVLPNVSTLQLAFARLGLAWQNARIGSVHSSDAGEWTPGADAGHGLYALLMLLRQSPLTAVLTSPENTPDRIARMLLAEGLQRHYQLAVAARLQQADEQISGWLTVEEAAGRQFADPNVLLVRQLDCRQEAVFGLADGRFQQRQPDKGLITKREVRAVALARMELRPDSIVWDLGAGSGSVGLEAARLCRHGHVYAIEKNADDVANVLANRASLGVCNFTLLHGKAPQGLADWPAPDAVFIGGSGGELAGLIELCLSRLRSDGWLVMNFATFENLATAIATLTSLNARWDVVQLQAARSKPILDMHRLQAENPIWLVCAQTGSAQEI